MIVRKTPVDVFLEHAYCVECGEELVRDNMMYPTNPPKYKYVCPKCGYSEYSHNVYPKLTYQNKEK